MLVFLVPAASAAQHPVPLDKGVKEDVCLQCHGDHAEGKVVHPAVQMGCFSCHFVRGSGDNTRVVLKTPKSTILCTSCHEDKKVAVGAKYAHPPVAKDCLQCHVPHTSDNKNLLKKPESGDKEHNLCLQCHTQGLNVPEKGSRHAALDMGCDACHVTHQAGSGKGVLESHLTKAAPALCLDCHDAKDSKLIEAHKGQPFATADCTTCHDPHQSKSPDLLQAYLHPPFADRTCEVCHDPAVNGKVKLNQPQVSAVCSTCHDGVAKTIATAKIPHPGAQADCTDCHNPHGGRFPRFLTPNPVAVCEGCHTEQAAAAPVVHGPVSVRCSICHTPHGGDNPKLLRANGNNLCLECHGPDAKGKKVADLDSITIFGGSITLPSNFLDSTARLPLLAGKGHPVAKHPVSGPDPSNPSKQITCLRCHVPHSGEAGLLIVEGVSTAPLCSQCHKNIK